MNAHSTLRVLFRALCFAGCVSALPVTRAAEIIIDNDHPTDVTFVGMWIPSSNDPGHLGDDYSHDNNASKGSKSATYTPAFPSAGSYQVYARWTTNPNRATNVPIDIHHNGSTTTVTVNQEINGAQWNLLGTYYFADTGTEGVTIRTTSTNGYVIADGVRFVSVPTEVIVDNDDTSGVTLVGDWLPTTYTTGYYDDNYVHDKNTGKGTKTIQFTPNLPAVGTYQVYMWWTAGANRATNVPVDIFHNGVNTTVTVNQQINGSAWNLLGTYSFAAGTAGYVKIRTTGTNGYVLGDAVLFSKVSGSTLPYSPPTLVSPTVLTPSQGVYMPTTSGSYSDSQDIEIQPYAGVRTGVMEIWGGRNVTMIGGHHQPTSRSNGIYMAVRLRDFANNAKIHVEGQIIDTSIPPPSGGLDSLHLGSGTNYSGSTWDNPKKADLTIQNCRLIGLRGLIAQNHSDALQTMLGTKSLRVSHVDVETNYQGFFLRQLNFSSGSRNPWGGGEMSFKNVYFKQNNLDNPDDSATESYIYIAGDTQELVDLFNQGLIASPIRITNVWGEVPSDHSAVNMVRPANAWEEGSDSISAYITPKAAYQQYFKDENGNNAKIRIGVPPASVTPSGVAGTMVLNGPQTPGYQYVKPAAYDDEL